MKHAPIAIVVALASACTSSCDEPQGPAGSPGRSARAGEGPPPIPRERAGEAQLERSVQYHDGETARTLWLSEDLVAEIAPSSAGRDALLAADADAAEVEQRQRAVRIWRVRAPQGADELARSLSRDSLRFSPVLHEGPSTGLPMRALPGGVVVAFREGWDRARIDAWLAARGRKVAEAVVPQANVYLVATPPGLAALELANELHATGELASATPNFWLEATTR
jgi:hypothetical protein